MSLTLSGLNEIDSVFAAVGAGVGVAALAAQHQAAREVLSSVNVPRVTGHLASTGRVEVAGDGAHRIVYDARYAVSRHWGRRGKLATGRLFLTEAVARSGQRALVRFGLSYLSRELKKAATKGRRARR